MYFATREETVKVQIDSKNPSLGNSVGKCNIDRGKNAAEIEFHVLRCLRFDDLRRVMKVSQPWHAVQCSSLVIVKKSHSKNRMSRNHTGSYL